MHSSALSKPEFCSVREQEDKACLPASQDPRRWPNNRSDTHIVASLAELLGGAGHLIASYFASAEVEEQPSPLMVSSENLISLHLGVVLI